MYCRNTFRTKHGFGFSRAKSLYFIRCHSSSLETNSAHLRKDISIPTVHGTISGILWTPSKSIKTSSSESPPPIVCLHGWQDNCGAFDPLLPHILKEDRTVLVYDLPGHGMSCHTQGSYYDHYLEGMMVIRKAMKQFGWEKVTLIGHSLSAQFNYIFSASFPECVYKYIGLDNFRPVPTPTGSSLLQRYKVVVEEVLKTEMALASGKERASFTYEELVQRRLKAMRGSASLEGCKSLVNRGSEKVAGTKDRYRFTHDVRINITLPFIMLTKEQSEIVGRGIKCPVCVIKGEPGDDYEPREDFVKAIENVRKTNNTSLVEYHTVPGTHHFFMNSPELVAPIINKFLDS